MNTPETSNARKIAEAVREFGANLKGAVESLARAARVYADAVAKYGDEACEAFQNAYPGVTPATWDKMRRVANGGLVPEAMLISDRAAARIERLPIKEQQKMLGGKKTLRVVTARGTVEDKPLSRLSPCEYDAVFSQSGKIRTEAEQRKFYADAAARKRVTKDYAIEGNCLRVFRATKFTKAELVEIVGRMK
jgi:hypothetical protein